MRKSNHTTVIARLIFCEIVALFILFVWDYRFRAPLGADTLVYHFSFPARWIKEGWFQMVPTWFATSQVSYNPILAELLYGLLMIPWKSEIVAKFLELPFLVMSAWCTYSIAKTVGCQKKFALLAGVGLLSFRPFLKEVFVGYNDIIFMSFFLLAVLMITRLHFSSRKELSIPLLGMSLGLLMATKYLGLVYIPPLLIAFFIILLLQRQYFSQVRFRRKAILAVLAVALFIPGTMTYLRNFILTRNPFYPADVTLLGINFFRGMFDPASVAPEYSLNSLWHELAGQDVSISYRAPGRTATFLVGYMVLAFILTIYSFRRYSRNALVVLIILFFVPVAGLLLTLERVPYSSARFMFPVFGLMWVYPAIASTNIAKSRYRISVITVYALAALVVMSASESFTTGSLVFVRWRTLALAGVLYVTIYWSSSRLSPLGRRIVRNGIIVLSLVALGSIYAYWPSYQNTYQIRKRERHVECWNWIDDATRDNPSVICYTGTMLTYPLYGSKLQNRVYYAHIAPGNFKYLHEYGAHFSLDGNESLDSLVKGLYRNKEDFDFWLQNIRSLQCDFLLVARGGDLYEIPIEDKWATEHPQDYLLPLILPPGLRDNCL